MGNCAAPPLAIIYMDAVEKRVVSQSQGTTVWRRYIDDIFFVTTSSAEELLRIANTVNPCIKFTLERPSVDEATRTESLAFLDTLVLRNEGARQLQLRLFIKPTHSGTCLPWKAHVPLSRKKCLVISETLRAQRIASSQHQNQSRKMITNKLTNNGYPPTLIRSVRRTMRTEARGQPDYVSFLKVPFISEQQENQIRRLHQQSGMANTIRLIFTTERPLSWQFRPPRETQECPPGCLGCKTAVKPACFLKAAVYEVTCSVCGAKYIGQTERTMRSRILEHLKTPTSHVYAHMQTHGANHQTSLTWRVLTTHNYTATRLALEALYIRRTGNKMNGCEGMDLLPFLVSAQ